MSRPTVPAIIQFGSTANPASEIGQYGAYTTLDFTNNLSALMAGTAWPRGWFAETINLNRPFIQDFNAVDFVFCSYLFYLMTLGVPEYIAAMTYWTNSIIQVSGQFFISLVDNNTGNTPASSPTQWQSGIPGMEITGAMKGYPGAVAPSGYLLCNGAAVNRTTYAALFTVCGTAYGVGDGSTTFNVPDARGKNLIAFLSGDPNFGTIGGVGGEATHTLIVAEVPGLSFSIPADSGSSFSTASFLGRSGSPGGNYNGNTNGGGGTHNNIQPYQTIGSVIIKT